MTDARDLVQRQFGAHARDYVTSQVHAKGESLVRLVELTRPQPGWHVLDVSTGAGHTALAVAPHVARVVATDLTAQMLDAAEALARDRGVANVEFRLADAEALPFEDGTFDLVTNRIALHHYAEAARAIREMARVCKRDGLVGFVDNVVPGDEAVAAYVNAFERLRDPSHVRAHSVRDLEGEFVAAGLRPVHVETVRKEMAFEPWVRRMGADADTRTRVRGMLLDAPHAVREFLTPRGEPDQLWFTLTEVVLVAARS